MSGFQLVALFSKNRTSWKKIAMIKMNQSLEIRSKGFIRIYHLSTWNGDIEQVDHNLDLFLWNIARCFIASFDEVFSYPKVDRKWLGKFAVPSDPIYPTSSQALIWSRRFPHKLWPLHHSTENYAIEPFTFKKLSLEKKVLRIRMTITLLNDSNCIYVSCIHMSQK